MSPFPQPPQSPESPPPKSRSRRVKPSVRPSARRPRRARKAARWIPRSEKARLRRVLQQSGLPHPTDRLRALRLLRNHPSALFRIVDLSEESEPLPSPLVRSRRPLSLRPDSYSSGEL